MKEILKDTADVIATLVEPVSPDAALRARLFACIADYEAVKPIADIRRHDGGWFPAGAEGVEMRSLFRDKETGRATLLLRMEPGARFPAHRHEADEQCYVISGDVYQGELVYREGDFVVMGRGSSHPEIHTVNGNLLLLVAGRNEFI